MAAPVVAALAVVATPRTARACSCLPPKPPLLAREGSDAVFEGRVYNVTTTGNRARYSFEVHRYWKGTPPERIEIETATTSAACGRSYDLGRPYMVYARRTDDGRYLDNACSRTRPLVQAAEDLEAFGAGTVPKRDDPDEPPAADFEMPLEPPRIPSPPGPPVTAPSKRGCAVEVTHGPGDATGLALVVILIAVGRRRALPSR